MRSVHVILTKEDRSVIAEVSDSVTRKVEELLGLTFSESCRAVVFPQGKFAEFLQLNGASRADMLGRIFDLARFGDRLFRLAVECREHARSIPRSGIATTKRRGSRAFSPGRVSKRPDPRSTVTSRFSMRQNPLRP